MLEKFSRRVRWAAIGIIVVLVGLLAYLNRQEVETNLLVMTIAMPRAVLIVVTGGIGFIGGWLTGRWRGT